MAFEIRDPDFDTSPRTGMTRKHWVDAGAFLLDGVFQHVEGFDDPITVSKQPGKSYPKPDDPDWKFRSAEFEGLSRTFMVASAILRDEPELEVDGFKLRDYYANQILRATDPESPNFVGTITELREEYGKPLFQHTAEGAALALGLMHSKEIIWDEYDKSDRDQIADLLDDYTHNMTNSHNWRWFNVIMASFLKLTGYPVDEGVMADHLQNLMAYYAGDGWYRDMGQFDFYSCWAFQYYAPIWCHWYGYKHEPEIAAVIERRVGELMKAYPLMFGRDGKSLMWGRSIIYRCAASAPLPAAFLLEETNVDPGWARRIASGNILQFLERDDAFVDGVPTLGFYRRFDPLVQGYSCAISPFWLAKVWAGMALPKTSPFWTATENEGEWDEIGDGQKTVVIEGPGLGITAHGPSGSAEVRPGKVASKKSNPNYTRLAYNTDFLWESDSPEGATAMAYSRCELAYENVFRSQGAIAFVGETDGVLYRQATLPGWLARADLADVPVPGGVLRVDRIRIPYSHELHLGHFGLPHLDGVEATVETRDVIGRPAILASIPGRRLAMVAYEGWDGVDAAVHTDLNAEAPQSTVIYARTERAKSYSGMYLTVTLMLHRTDDGAWTDADLNVVGEFETIPWTENGQPLGARLALTDGREFSIDWTDVEGRKST